MIEIDDHGTPREACGVVGIWHPSVPVARWTWFALYALQHRGQESAGIATLDRGRARLERGMGLVSQVFDEERIERLRGPSAIGHTRYSTTGASNIENAQPHVLETPDGPIAIAHNGNLTNVEVLRARLRERGQDLSQASDSEVLLHLIARPLGPVDPDLPRWIGRLAALFATAEGAYSLTVFTPEGVIGLRDPHGFRPLCLGALDHGWILASETCALETVGARFLREVAPGEIVRIGPQGVQHWRPRPTPAPALCVFEYVYFARPDSVLEGRPVHLVRERLGRELARKAPCEADVVIGVPDSALPAAMGYAAQSGIPYGQGLTKNRYVRRTFIQPDAALRRHAVRLKYTALRSTLAGRRVVLVDDSIVRGNTVSPLVQLLFEAGATEVHVRVASPPVRHPCFMGVDLGSYDEIFASRASLDTLRERIGATSLAYLPVSTLIDTVDRGAPSGTGHCRACFTGAYPTLPDRSPRGHHDK